MNQNSTFIGLTGRMASGKGEAVKFFESLGFQAISLSDLVREEAEKTGGAFTREQMQDLGNRMRTEEGPGVLGKRVREKIEHSSVGRWVIDGIRNPAEVEELRKLKNFLLIAVEAPVSLLLERMRSRSRASDRISEADMRKSLEREWGIGEPDGGQQVGECVNRSDFIIDNSGTLEAFLADLHRLAKQKGIIE